MSQDFLKQLETIFNSAVQVFQIIATFLIAFLVVLWLTLCFWTFRDIQARTRDLIAQVFATLLVFFFNIPGVLLYILVRPKETLVQSYERSLQEEYMLQDLEEREICPTCRVKTQPDFHFCFNCRTRLRRQCPSCDQLIKLKWASCPFCGTPQKARPRDSMAAAAGLGAPRTGTARPSARPASTALATTPLNGNGLAPAHPRNGSTYAPNASFDEVTSGYGPNPNIGNPSSTYTSNPAINNAPTNGSQPYAADGGQDYTYEQEQAEPVYNYQNDHRPYMPQRGIQTEPADYDEQLTAEIAPELAPDAGSEQSSQSTRPYQPPRQRRTRRANNPNSSDDEQ